MKRARCNGSETTERDEERTGEAERLRLRKSLSFLPRAGRALTIEDSLEKASVAVTVAIDLTHPESKESGEDGLGTKS